MEKYTFLYKKNIFIYIICCSWQPLWWKHISMIVLYCWRARLLFNYIIYITKIQMVSCTKLLFFQCMETYGTPCSVIVLNTEHCNSLIVLNTKHCYSLIVLNAECCHSLTVSNAECRYTLTVLNIECCHSLIVLNAECCYSLTVLNIECGNSLIVLNAECC